MAALHDDPVLADVLARLIRRAGVTAVVETGTFHGDSTRWFAARVPDVWTVEIREDFRSVAIQVDREQRERDRLGGQEPRLGNVAYALGDSRVHLRDMLAQACARPGTVLCWLDAHWRDAWPLRAELEICGSQRGAPGSLIVVVDDFVVPGRPQFQAPAGGGGTPGHPMYGPRDSVDPTEASLATFGDLLGTWRELWFPDYDALVPGYVVASDVPLGPDPVLKRWQQ